MTTLVYSKALQVLASDTCVSNGASYGIVSKIARHKKSGDIAGVAGAMNACMPWLYAFEKYGFKPSKLPLLHDSTAILVEKATGKVWYIEDGKPGAFTFDHPFYAVGSGEQYALGALAMGATPEEAVRVASTFEPGRTNDIIETLAL